MYTTPTAKCHDGPIKIPTVHPIRPPYLALRGPCQSSRAEGPIRLSDYPTSPPEGSIMLSEDPTSPPEAPIILSGLRGP